MKYTRGAGLLLALTMSALAMPAADAHLTADQAALERPSAAEVPDLSRPVRMHAASGTYAAEATTTRIGSCGHWVDVWFRQRSALGHTLYKWHHRVVYCQTRRRITEWQNRYDYLTDASSIIYFRELEVNQQGGLGASRAWSHRQRHLEYCVAKYGCYASTHPWSRIKIYADGHYTYTGDS